jgi:hypothetical protein
MPSPESARPRRPTERKAQQAVTSPKDMLRAQTRQFDSQLSDLPSMQSTIFGQARDLEGEAYLSRQLRMRSFSLAGA